MGKVKKNLFYQTIYQILAILLPLITMPIVTRSLGANGLGQYSYTYAIVSYFSIFALLGVNTYGTREISIMKTRNNKKLLSETFCGIYYFQLILSIIVISLYYVYVFAFVDKNKVLAMLQGLYLLGAITDVSWLYFGLEQFKVTVIRNIFVKVGSAIVIILAVKEPEDLYLYAFTIIASTVISNAVLVLGIRRYVGFTKLGLKKITIHLKPNLILFIPVIAASIFTYMDKIMIGNFSDTVQNGYFDAMEKIINVPMACVSAIANVMFPRISALVKLKSENNQEKIKEYVELSLIAVIWFAFACIFGMGAIAKEFVPLFLGREFYAAVLVVALGCVIILPRAVRIIINSECLLPNQKDKYTIISILSASACNLVVNIFLIPRYGATGAVIATITSEMLCCLLMARFAGKNLQPGRIIIITVPFFIFGFAMYSLINVLASQLSGKAVILRLGIEIILGGGMYALLSAVYLYILWKKRLRHQI